MYRLLLSTLDTVHGYFPNSPGAGRVCMYATVTIGCKSSPAIKRSNKWKSFTHNSDCRLPDFVNSAIRWSNCELIVKLATAPDIVHKYARYVMTLAFALWELQQKQWDNWWPFHRLPIYPLLWLFFQAVHYSLQVNVYLLESSIV